MNENRKPNRRRRGLIALLMAGTALISATGATMSLALFTDSASANANAFTTGTIRISDGSASTVLAAPAMMPGDTVNGSVVISNTGSAELRYSVTGSASNADGLSLAGQLVVTIRRADGNTGAACTAFTGDLLWTGNVPYVQGVLIGTNFGVNHPYGAGARTLSSGVGETLCFRANLPSSTGDAFQGATTNMTFTFYAEQTANN
jgi:predicted ribosomally synthesized peptide with SipW-like signal peptide